MKKTIMTLFVALAFAGAAFADNFAHDASVLPAPAKSLIEQNFQAPVSVVKIDKELGSVKEYEVTLCDGTEVCFDGKGNWKDVESNCNSSVPKDLLLRPIRNYLSENHDGEKVIGIEKSGNKIEVTLANGVEMKFSKTGKFICYDK